MTTFSMLSAYGWRFIPASDLFLWRRIRRIHPLHWNGPIKRDCLTYDADKLDRNGQYLRIREQRECLRTQM